ncbi:GAF domain-containing protein [Gemmatimonas groenlandica]|uniref:GAF domain-containing protein n=1 Tax=Gemmatimonas groenlandica TaxID=2732249 RepID=UPI001E496228|nr:GAF domain-containing protein [Gemmatimonas groenlandica]
MDRLTRVVSRILNVPVAAVSLVDDRGQSFAGLHGLGGWARTARGTPLSHSFCQHVVVDDAPLVIEDARLDQRLQDNLAIAGLGVVAYAGVPLTTRDGETLGALCAIDTQSRLWSSDDLETLQDLAAAAVAQLQLRAALRDVSDAHDVMRLEQERLWKEHERLTTIDPMTGLLSRTGGERALRGVQTAGTLHTIAIDGDDLARMIVAAALVQVGGANAVCARVAPSVLAMFRPDAASGHADSSMAAPMPASFEERLLAALRAPIGSRSAFSVRVGSVHVPAHSTEALGALLRTADAGRDASAWHCLTPSRLSLVASSAGPRVLLLDDYPSVLDWARTALQDGGCTVHTAVAADEALVLAASLREAGTPLDMIICDSAVQHVDGEMIGMLLRFDNPDLPVIRLGGEPASTGTATSSSDAYVSVVSKPVSPPTLLDCVVRARRVDISSGSATC